MKLSVIVPVFNEEKTVEALLSKLLKIKEVDEVVAVDDNSSDKTPKILKEIKNRKLKILSHKQNQGKGKAIQTGLKAVTGDYVLIQDADLEYDPIEIPKLLSPIEEGKTEVVYGSRFLGPRTNMFFWHYLGNQFLNLVINILYNSILTDMETCYKVMPTKLMKSLNLTTNDFRIEPEITCKLLRQKVRIMEVPITFLARTYDEGKKITWRDGYRALAIIIKVRLFG